MRDKTDFLFSCGAFAELCNTTKATLRHYEKRGLLLPAVIRDNQYRYYSFEQLYEYDFIRTEILCGKTLAEIRAYLRCPGQISYTENAVGNLEKLKARRKELDRVITGVECAIRRDNRMSLADIRPGVPGIRLLGQTLAVIATEIGPTAALTEALFTRAAKSHLRLCEDVLNISRFPWGYMVRNYSGNPYDPGQISYYYSLYPFSDIGADARPHLFHIPRGAYACVRFPRTQYNPRESYRLLHAYLEREGYRAGHQAYESGVYADAGASGRRYLIQLAIRIDGTPVSPSQESDRQKRGDYRETGTC